jgi:hypothetical protein
MADIGEKTAKHKRRTINDKGMIAIYWLLSTGDHIDATAASLRFLVEKKCIVTDFSLSTSASIG